MGILTKLFKSKKNHNPGEEFKLKKLNDDGLKQIGNEYKTNPHFIAICEYDKCYRPIYRSEKYQTIFAQGKHKKVHTRCLRKMRKEAKKLISSGVQVN